MRLPREVWHIILNINKKRHDEMWLERKKSLHKMIKKLGYTPPFRINNLSNLWLSGRVGMTIVKVRKKYVETYTRFLYVTPKRMLTKVYIKSDLIRAVFITIIGFKNAKLLRNKEELCYFETFNTI